VVSSDCNSINLDRILSIKAIKNMSDFGIKIKEEDSYILSDIVIDENEKMVEMHDWQRRATKFFFDNDCVAILEAATGTGKSFTTIKIIQKVLEKDPDIYILIVVPKNVILERTWFKELYDGGFSLKDIGVYYGNIKEYAKITITNMQSLNKVAIDMFDMIIFDECHNYCSKRLWKYIKHPFKYRLGLSATLERMDNEHYTLMKHFNFNVFKYTPKQALIDGVLNPFNFTNIGVEMDNVSYDEYLKLTEDFNLMLQMGGGFNKIMATPGPLKNQMLAKMNERKQLVLNYPKKFDVICQICENHKEDKILIFNEYNEQTSACYWHLLEGGFNSRVMHSGISKEKREQNLTDFKNDKYNILCTSRVLDEGYNLPKIDTAIIAAGNSTSRQSIQRMGRVLRKKDKISSLYQIYVKRTMEEDYAFERTKLFKELCNEYQDIDFR